MKKSLIFLLLLYKSAFFGQTVLTSHALDLKKSAKNIQILNAENLLTHEVFVFAAYDQNITILKYNSALFLTDQYTGPLVNLENKELIASSFSEDGNPSLYWTSRDFKEIIVIKYYLETKTYKALKFGFPSESQYVVATFQDNNLFYILSKPISEQTLAVYTFKNGMVEEKIFDFSLFKFQNKNTSFLPFTELIKQNPIEKMEFKDYNPLYKSTAKSKVYLQENKMVLTLDQNPKQTQVFEINLDSHTLNEKIFVQPNTKKPLRSSNSFLAENKLFQVTANKEELLFDVKDYGSGLSIKSIHVAKNDTIRFKNSPLLIQREYGKPGEIKKTAKFLHYLSNLDIGLSVFKNKKNTLITLGGTPKSENLDYYAQNFGQYDDEFGQIFSPITFYPNVHTETVFFESALNKNFEFSSSEPSPLAVDKISYFLNQHQEAAFANVIPFKDYFILGYYDQTSKEYILRKFKDGFN
nr:hypothetical protein [uncultured Flavobacterium sp.]